MADVVLSKRMQALTDMVTPGTAIADVGCDHGFVSVYLVQKGICPRAIAMDVRSGPLARAEEHIRAYGLTEQIETRLSDGLQQLRPGDATGMLCAGMGGRLMERILTEGRTVARGLEELILQPQSELPEFRRFLMAEGYLLEEENIIYEEGKYYFLMKVHWQGEMTDEVVNRAVTASWLGEAGEPSLQYGRFLLERRDPVLQQYLERTLADRRQIKERLGQLADGENPRTGERLADLDREIADLAGALERYRKSLE